MRREVNRQSMKKLVSRSHQADGLLLKDPKVGTFHRCVPDRALRGKLGQKFINRVVWYSKWSREAGMVCQQRSLTLRKVSPNTAEPRKLHRDRAVSSRWVGMKSMLPDVPNQSGEGIQSLLHA